MMCVYKLNIRMVVRNEHGRLDYRRQFEVTVVLSVINKCIIIVFHVRKWEKSVSPL
jgi:hypothetical protein